MAPSIMYRLQSFMTDTKRILRPAHATGENKNPLLDMLYHNWYLGFTSFGGPAVHFQIFRRLFVERYQWIDEQTYQEQFALCQALPGPGSTKMHFAINTFKYGFWVGVVAFLIWSLPMAIAAFGLALGVSNIGTELPGPVYGLLSGLNAATVGIIALAAYQLAQKAITDPLTRILVFFGATAGMLYNAIWYFPVIMIVGGVSTTIWDTRVLQRLSKALFGRQTRQDVEATQAPIPLSTIASTSQQPTSETVTSRSQHSSETKQTSEQTATTAPSPTADEPPSHTQDRAHWFFNWKTGSIIILAFFLSFTVVMVLRGTLSHPPRAFSLFANLYLAGTIIFGGGPVVIPLLREYVVTEGWVSSRDFLLGLAICQALPGPNFNFAVYLGALAVRSVPAVGALAAYAGIFAPGLILHLGTMGVWGSLRRLLIVRAALRGVHAAAVGLVYTAVYRLFEIGAVGPDFQEGASLGRDPWWIVIVATSFVGGLNFGVSPPVAIALGCVMGLVWYGVNKSQGNVA